MKPTIAIGSAHLSEPALEASRLMTEGFRLWKAFLQCSESMAAENGLTTARWQVLDGLRERSATVASLARQLGLTRQSVQRTAGRLEADGFVRFNENPEHKRAALMRLTQKGKAALARLDQAQATWLETVTRELPPANLRIAIGMLRGLTGRIIDAAS